MSEKKIPSGADFAKAVSRQDDGPYPKPVYVEELRDSLPGVVKEDFDALVMDLARKRIVSAQTSDFALDMSEKDRARLVYDPTSNLYFGIFSVLDRSGLAAAVDDFAKRSGASSETKVQPEATIKSRGVPTRKSDRKGFASAGSGSRARIGSAVNVVGQGEGVVTERGPDFAWVKLNATGETVKVLHGVVEPLIDADTPSGTTPR